MRTSFVGVASSSGSGPGAPGAIRNLLATPANESAVLSWTAPVSNGGSAITDHEFQASAPNLGGTLDGAFVMATGTGLNFTADSVAVQSDGKIVCVGSFTSFNGTALNYIVRLNASGTVDTAFVANIGTGFNDFPESVVIQPDGKIICGGSFTSFNGATVNRIVRLNSDGTRDTTFTTNTGTGFNVDVNSIAIQSDGKIICGGFFTSFNGVTVNRIARLNSNGTLDATFATNTGTGFDFQPYSLATQSDGKIIVAGSFTSFNGTTTNRIARLNSNGTLDTAFATNTGTDFLGNQIDAIAVQSDGKIVCVGDFITFNSTVVNHIVRLNSNGTVDTAFTANTGTAFSHLTLSLAIQTDGKIIVGGNFTSFNGTTSRRIARLNSDGTLDTVFTANTGGAVIGGGFSGRVESIAIQSDGKIICGGLFTTFNSTTVGRIAQLNGDEIWSNTVSSGSSGTSYTFTGLTNSTYYVFRVRAVNAIGAGPWVETTIPVAFFPTVSGGTLTSDSTYYYRTFTANGTLAVGNVGINLDYFVIAGGGQGASGSQFYDGFQYWYTLSGGGGASGTKAFSSAIFAVNSYSVVIGGAGSGSSIGTVVSVTAGGNGAGGDGGSNAEFSGATGSYPSGGGGAGANGNGSGIDGGSAFSAFGINYGLGGFSQTGSINFSPGSPNPGYSAPSNSGSGGGGGRGNVSGGIGGSGRVIVRYLRSAVGG
jgi:uncharacterized delta-60 repeat protein